MTRIPEIISCRVEVLPGGGKEKPVPRWQVREVRGPAGGLGHGGGSHWCLGRCEDAPGVVPWCRSHACLLCCRSDSSVPPSVSGSLVSDSDLTLAWWVILRPFSQPQTFHQFPPHTGSRAQAYPGGEGTPYPLWGNIADRSSQPKMARGVAEPASYFHSLWQEGSRKAHR